VANYQRNTAYNYESVAPKRRRAAKSAEIKTLPRRRSKTKAHSSSPIAKIAVAGLIIFMICFNLSLRANIFNVKNEISAAEQEIEKLDSERVRLEMALENKISYDNIEIEAKKLGMQKVSKSQIHYIDTTDVDSAEIITAE
jgi:cell division protein FtsL